MKRLKFFNRKGFTLVECIVAIAVFAVMTSMVLLIVASTLTLSKESADAEKGLNTLVQNVVKDGSNKLYDAENTLEMDFNGKPFQITYTTVDGARCRFLCPSCGYEGNVTEFMNDIYSKSSYVSAEDSEKDTYAITHWFDPAVDSFKCPKCSTVTAASSRNYECEVCGKRGGITDFDYDGITGGFVCRTPCGSTQVILVDPSTNLRINESEDYKFQVTTMQPNAIRYGNIAEPTDEEREDFVDITCSNTHHAKTFRVTVSYTPTNDPAAAGIYTMRLDSFTPSLEGDETAEVKITLPPCYIFTMLPSSTGINVPGETVNDNYPNVTITAPSTISAYKNTKKYTELKITDIKSTSGIVIKFTLTNYKNNQSFNEDFSEKGGLMKFFYGINSGNSFTYTRTEEEGT